MGTFLSSNLNKKSNQLNQLLGGLNNLSTSSAMDPASIFGTINAVGAVANVACTLALQLYTFVENTRTVNQAVTDLVEEVNALSSILEAVKLGLKSDLVKLAEKRANSDDSRLLWESIQGSLRDCRAILDRLENAIVDVRPEGRNFAEQAVRRFRLNLKDSDITAFRTQIRTHINALQMALLMINLRAACLAPGAVTDELGPKIDELRAFMELVHGNEADLKTKAMGVEPEYLTGLRRSAQKVISSATTVSANSEMAGSMWGEVMDEEKRDETLLWIPEPETYDEHDRPSTIRSPSDDHSVSQTTALTDYSVSNAEEAESDSEGDFEAEVFETFFARGSDKFKDGNWVEAQSILQKSLQLAERLPLKRRQPAKIAEIKLMIATAIYHSPNLHDAETKLLAITQEKVHENVTDEGAMRRCQASHLLAGVLFRQGRFSLAKSFCRKALIGRRRILGKNHISCYESLSMLSQICEAEGQQDYAETYWAMIPEEVASKLVKMKDEFPDMLKKPPRPLGADEISSTPLPPEIKTGRSQSTSPEAQFGATVDGTEEILMTRTALISLSPTISTASASTASTPSIETSPMPRKKSLFRKFKRRQTSVASTTSTNQTEVPLSEEKVQRRPPLAGAPSQSFEEHLKELVKLQTQKNDSVSWPGLH